MAEEISDQQYHSSIHERGWATWLHVPRADGYLPKVHKGWKKKTQPVSVDRQVTVAWDPTRFTDELGEQHLLVEVFRNDTYQVVLFPVT